MPTGLGHITQYGWTDETRPIKGNNLGKALFYSYLQIYASEILLEYLA